MKKAERVDRVDNTLSIDELQYRLPEVDAIYIDELQEIVYEMFLNGVPDRFWTAPSSSTGKYHSDDECGKYGNLIHTKRVFVEYCSLSEPWLDTGRLSEYERECGKAAALLHDTFKYGWPSENNEHTVEDHDVIAANVAKHIAGAPNKVYLLIHAHMGQWGSGMLPETDNQWLLHQADYAASNTPADRRAIYYPTDEILEEQPDIPVIEHEEGDYI